MAVITKRKNNLKSKSSMKTKRSSKSKSNSKTRKQFKKFRKNGMGTRKMRGGRWGEGGGVGKRQGAVRRRDPRKILYSKQQSSSNSELPYAKLSPGVNKYPLTHKLYNSLKRPPPLTQAKLENAQNALNQMNLLQIRTKNTPPINTKRLMREAGANQYITKLDLPKNAPQLPPRKPTPPLNE
jgi:hypothetical protein